MREKTQIDSVSQECFKVDYDALDRRSSSLAWRVVSSRSASLELTRLRAVSV